MSMTLNIVIDRAGKAPLTMRYDASERQKAMDEWDRVVENALPGQRVRLVNPSNNRMVSEYTNNKQS